MNKVILSLQNITKTFALGAHEVRAIDDVSLDIHRGECLAIVGESGSGKSTLANMILGIFEPTSGEILFNNSVLPAVRDLPLRRAIQLVQQNPLSSLNPRRKIAASLRLALDVHSIGDKNERQQKIGELLEEVGLTAEQQNRFPSALSGGQRQRVAIARALACQSELLVLDEPTSALDVLVQARVLNLLNELRAKRQLTYIFITHDLSVVRNIADRVAVFRHGKLVELNKVEKIFSSPDHAYTRGLIAAIPVVTQDEVLLRDSLGNDGSTGNHNLLGNKEETR
ncbi:MAG: ABC transporter ATP-binding protein [Rhizobiales bacterium]|nr:ATP-binding cassette domain-containing protein [Hyphomicrobiales bacterium]NRB15499.1 ABC transporter ATP-binding protein [Hyphomicrobiales bacterium]